jgi:hypothetical protein
LGTLCEGRADGATSSRVGMDAMDYGVGGGGGFYELPPGMVGDPMISDEFLQVLADEPWMANIF